MDSDNHDDGWDSFDWQQWGADEQASNGHDGSLRDEQRDLSDQLGDDRRTSLEGEPSESQQPGGKWVTEGGVMRWETPDDAEEAVTLQDEARSPFAADDFTVPAGAPPAARVRAVRAWLARQRERASEAIGYLLIERRQLQSAESVRDAGGRAEPVDGDDPLELALAEHQATMQEYEQLIEALDDIVTHSGPTRALIEYHLWLSERLAELARAPEAPATFAAQLLLAEVEDEEQSDTQPRGATSARSHAEWEGRAEADAKTRRRVEWVSASEAEE
ncbi:MAG TPA: hypothetical protein VJN88_04535 [Ktedonobacterales bacterium]|nr:hypothetical protein [Ktedonobacterales bacterium]